MLIQLTGIERIPRVQFDGHAQVNEPVVLQRLPEVTGRVRRDVGADIGDVFKFALAGRVGFLRCEFASSLRVALGEADDGVRRNHHRLKLLPFCLRLRVAVDIERVEAGLDIGLEVEHPLAIDFVVQHGVARRALLHKLGKNPRVIGVQPFRRHLLEDALAHGEDAAHPRDAFAHPFTLPEGDDGVRVALPRFGADGEGDFLPRVQDV